MSLFDSCGILGRKGAKALLLGLFAGLLCSLPAKPKGLVWEEAVTDLVATRPQLTHFLSGTPGVLVPFEDGSGYLLHRGETYTCQTLEGQIHGEAHVHYLRNAVIDGRRMQGYFYHDETGNFLLTGGRELDLSGLSCRDEVFTGRYQEGSFGGISNPPGILVYQDMDQLEQRLEETAGAFEGEWSWFLRNMDSGQTICRGDGPIISASMIKLFVMESVYANFELVERNLAGKRGLPEDDPAVEDEIFALLENMICFSDNESFNELVRLHASLEGEESPFLSGAACINGYLTCQGYADTVVGHTLAPCASLEEGNLEANYTSARDCGVLLSRVQEEACISQEASLQMLSFLLWQDNDTKIRTALPDGVLAANKTGETSDQQHDSAIIYGRDATVVLSIFSTGCDEYDAIDHIRELTALVVEFLGL